MKIYTKTMKKLFTTLAFLLFFSVALNVQAVATAAETAPDEIISQAETAAKTAKAALDKDDPQSNCTTEKCKKLRINYNTAQSTFEELTELQKESKKLTESLTDIDKKITDYKETSSPKTDYKLEALKAQKIAIDAEKKAKDATIQARGSENCTDGSSCKMAQEKVTETKKEYERLQSVVTETGKTNKNIAITESARKELLKRQIELKKEGKDLSIAEKSQLEQLDKEVIRLNAQNKLTPILSKFPDRDKCKENPTCNTQLKTYEDAAFNANKAKKQFINAKQLELSKKTMKLKDYGIIVGNVNTLEQLIANIIKYLARMIGIFAVFSIMIGGIMMIISTGDENLQSRGKSLMMYGALAVVIVLSAYVIVTTVQQILYALGS